MKTAICIFPTSNHKELTQYFTDITTYYANRMKFVAPDVEILYANSIDHGLKEYGRSYNHILFMASGCRIFQESIVVDIDKEIQKNPDYLCAAHILDWTNKNEWYELHQQFVLINTDTWKDIGSPKFGGWTEKEIELPIVERSVENFHDDYTPLWINDSGERKVQRCGHPGWNFLDKGLRMGCDIINWNQEIRSKRTYYYPETDSDMFWECIKEKKVDPSVTNFNQKNFLNFLVHGVQDQIWLYNSEEMALEHNKKYDAIALPASGFKYLDIFKSDMLNKNGKIIIYDFNPKAIQWIKTIHQSRETNIDSIASKFEHQKNFKQIKGYGLNKTIEYFEDLDKFKMYLNKFREMDIIFIECDIVKKPEPLLDLIKDGESLLHISNIFSTDWLIATYGLEYAQERLRYLLETTPRDVQLTGMTPTYPSVL